MTNILAIGLIITNCQGTLVQRWSNVGCHVILQAGDSVDRWTNVLEVKWLDCPAEPRKFEIPLKDKNDARFYRLLSN